MLQVAMLIADVIIAKCMLLCEILVRMAAPLTQHFAKTPKLLVEAVGVREHGFENNAG